jgi:hypothetical protein
METAANMQAAVVATKITVQKVAKNAVAAAPTSTTVAATTSTPAPFFAGQLFSAGGIFDHVTFGEASAESAEEPSAAAAASAVAFEVAVEVAVVPGPTDSDAGAGAETTTGEPAQPVVREVVPSPAAMVAADKRTALPARHRRTSGGGPSLQLLPVATGDCCLPLNIPTSFRAAVAAASVQNRGGGSSFYQTSIAMATKRYDYLAFGLVAMVVGVVLLVGPDTVMAAVRRSRGQKRSAAEAYGTFSAAEQAALDRIETDVADLGRFAHHFDEFAEKPHLSGESTSADAAEPEDPSAVYSIPSETEALGDCGAPDSGGGGGCSDGGDRLDSSSASSMVFGAMGAMETWVQSAAPTTTTTIAGGWGIPRDVIDDVIPFGSPIRRSPRTSPARSAGNRPADVEYPAECEGTEANERTPLFGRPNQPPRQHSAASASQAVFDALR